MKTEETTDWIRQLYLKADFLRDLVRLKGNMLMNQEANELVSLICKIPVFIGRKKMKIDIRNVFELIAQAYRHALEMEISHWVLLDFGYDLSVFTDEQADEFITSVIDRVYSDSVDTRTATQREFVDEVRRLGIAEFGYSEDDEIVQKWFK